MAFGTVDERFWTDEKVLSYSDNGKLLALYLLTCKHRTLIGCYRLPMEYICADLKWAADQAALALSELAAGDRPFLVRDRNGWTAVVNFLRYQKLTSPNHFKALDFQLSRLPASSPTFSVVCAALSDIWVDKWHRRPKVLEATNELLLGYSEATSEQPGSYRLPPAPAPAPAPAPKKELRKDAEASPRAKLFNGCLEWLIKRSGKTEDHCRTLIGKWISTAKDDGLVFSAFVAAQGAGRGVEAFEPISYITAALKPKPKKKTEQMPL